MPLHSLGVTTTILDWLDSLPKTVLDARPWSWVRSATSTLMAGRTTGVEEKLQAAKKPCKMPTLMTRPATWLDKLPRSGPRWRCLRYQPEEAIIQARHALEYLHADNLPFRSRAIWTLGFAHHRSHRPCPRAGFAVTEVLVFLDILLLP